MSRTLTIPWLRIGAESVAIVASILLAFAIDAWWAERSDRSAEREELSRLQVEFTWNRDRVRENIAMQKQAHDASLALLEMMRSHDARSESLLLPNELLLDINRAPTFDAATPVLDGLVLSGGLDVVQDRDVLAAIALWSRWVTQALETELIARDLVTERIFPALIERGDLSRVYSSVGAIETLDGSTAVRIDDQLLGLMARRAALTALAGNNLEGLEASADAVLDSIARALSKGLSNEDG